MQHPPAVHRQMQDQLKNRTAARMFLAREAQAREVTLWPSRCLSPFPVAPISILDCRGNKQAAWLVADGRSGAPVCRDHRGYLTKQKQEFVTGQGI